VSSRGRDARFILYEVLTGSEWHKSRVAGSIIDLLDTSDYLTFECQKARWMAQVLEGLEANGEGLPQAGEAPIKPRLNARRYTTAT
jgi:hypothetical protein